MSPVETSQARPGQPDRVEPTLAEMPCFNYVRFWPRMESGPFPHQNGCPWRGKGAGGAEHLVVNLPEHSVWVGAVDRPIFTSWAKRANLGEQWWVSSATPSNQGSECSSLPEETREGHLQSSALWPQPHRSLWTWQIQARAPPSGDRQTDDFFLSPNFPQVWFLG